MSVNIAIIGCGAAAERYYVPALKKCSSKIGDLFLVDPNQSRAEKIFHTLGRGQVFSDHRKIIDRIKGAVVAVPHSLHHSISMDFLKAGVNVLCEKPLAEDLQQVREMVETAGHHNIALCVNNTRRMFPSLRKVKEIISQGQLGGIKSIEFIEGSAFGWNSSTGFYVDYRVSSKGILLDLGSHVIDTICWWLNEKPELMEFKDDSFGGPESVMQLLANGNGCEIRVFLNRLLDLESRYTVICENGTIEGKPMDWKYLEIRYPEGRTTSFNLDHVSRNYPGFVTPVFENFVRVLSGEEIPLVSGSDVLNSIEFIQECYAKRTRFCMPEYDGIHKTESPLEGQVLITGASGFIGGRLAEILHLSNKQKVKAAINRWPNAARLGRFSMDTVQMDLMDPVTIENALDGVTDVVHCAKGTYDVTVQGTKNLLESALRKGVRRFIHMSTTEVYGNVTGEIDENAPLAYSGNEYNRMKVDAEKICLQYIKKGLPITVLRPSIVYGPFSKSWTIRFANLMLNRKWGLLEGIGNGRCNLVYVDDLVNAILLSLHNEETSGEAFNIVGPEVVTWNEYFYRYNECLGMPSLKRMPSAIASTKARMMQPIRMLGGVARKHFMQPLKKIAEAFEPFDNFVRGAERALKSTPHPDELKLYSRNVLFVTARARKVLNFNPEITLEAGLARAVDWLRHNQICKS